MRPAHLAEEVVLTWARTYTRGVDRPVAQRRLAELASDCHEQRQWGQHVGAPPVVVATSMVARTLAGLPADLHWRHTNRATVRDPSHHTTGRSMDWVRHNWWLVLAALAGALQVALGVMLPLEDRTTGAIVGGAVTASAGIAMLVGIWLRRRRRVAGDLLVAGGTLTLMPWLWTVVLPLLGLVVLVPALVDAADAGATAVPHPGSSRATAGTAPGSAIDRRPTRVVRAVLAGLVAATAVAAAVVGDPVLVATLVAPALGLLVGVLAMGRVAIPLVRLGGTLAIAVVVSGLATMALVLWVGGIDPTSTAMSLAGLVGEVVLGAGVVLVFVGLARQRVRPG